MTTTVCAECTSEIYGDSEFCPECGFPAKPGYVSCPECQNPVLLSLDACPECGLPLEELRQSHDSQVQNGTARSESAGASNETHAVRQPRATTGGDLDGDEEYTNQVLQAQIEALGDLTAIIGKMIDNDGKGGQGGSNDMLSDLITNIGMFVESSEKIKDDMLNSMKEQNLITISAMKEIAGSFTGEVKSAAEAQKVAAAEMNALAQQVKAAVTKKQDEPAAKADNSYLLYVGVLMLFFTMMNFLVTAYVVKLVK